MDYEALRARMDEYSGPMLVMRPESRSIYNVPCMLDVPGTGSVYSIDIDQNTGGIRFTSQNGREHKMSEVMPYDREDSSYYMLSRVRDFQTMGDLAKQVRESFPELEPSERRLCCENLCNMWQAATMMQGESEQSFRIGSAFENMMSQVGPMQESFLKYLETGCASYASYFGLESEGDMKAKTAEFEKTAQAAAYQFMDVYGKTTAPTPNKQFANAVAYGAQWPMGEEPKNQPELVLSDDEQQALSDFAKELSAVSDERAKFESPFGEADMTGVKFKDFNITMPYGTDLTDGNKALDADMPGVGEFETVELRESCGRDFRLVAKRLGYEPRTTAGALMNELDDYGGPKLIAAQGSDFLHGEIQGIQVRGYHTRLELSYMLNPDAGDSEKNMIGPYNEACTERSVVPMDRSEMTEEDREIRSEEFAELSKLAMKVHDASYEGKINFEEQRELCERISAMWQANTLPSLGANQGHGRDFDNIQVHNRDLREGFLRYVAAGADAYAAYYDDNTSAEVIKEKFELYADTAWDQASDVAAICGDQERVSTQEAASMVESMQNLNARAQGARGDFATGLRLDDFEIPMPDGVHVAAQDSDITDKIPDWKISAMDDYARGEPELSESEVEAYEMGLSGDSNADFGVESGTSETEPESASKPAFEDKVFDKPEPASSRRDIRDLEMAADDIEGRSGNQIEDNHGFEC